MKGKLMTLKLYKTYSIR